MLFIAPDIVTLKAWVILPVLRENACWRRSMERSEITGIRARCGFLCSDCRSYKENIHSDADRERLSVVFEKIYGYTIAPGNVNCDGCIEPDQNSPRRLGTECCPIRDCVLEKGIVHCGRCDIFPCDLMERHLATVETVVTRARKILTPEEYGDFVEPYLIRGFLEGR